MQLLRAWHAFPGLPWLSDFLDTAVTQLTRYGRSQVRGRSMGCALAAMPVWLLPLVVSHVWLRAPSGGVDAGGVS